MADIKHVPYQVRSQIDGTLIDTTRVEVTCCGESFLILNPMGDHCEICGQWYNFGGQLLRPPREWGEETGERFGDEGEYLGGGDDD